MSNGPKVRSIDWERLEEFFGEPSVEPILKLVQLIRQSPAATELYGGQSHYTLLISNEPEFEMFGNAIHVSYNPTSNKFSFKHRVNPGPEDSRDCASAEGAATLRLFVKYKYGVLLN